MSKVLLVRHNNTVVLNLVCDDVATAAEVERGLEYQLHDGRIEIDLGGTCYLGEEHPLQ